MKIQRLLCAAVILASQAFADDNNEIIAVTKSYVAANSAIPTSFTTEDYEQFAIPNALRIP